MAKTLNTEKASSERRSQPERRRPEGSARIVNVDDKIQIELQLGGEPGGADAALANFVLEGMASFGSQLAEVVEEGTGAPPPEFAVPLGEVSSRAARQMLAAAEGRHGEITGLSKARRKALARNLQRLLAALVDAAYVEGASPKQIDDRGQAAVDTLELLAGNGAERLGPLLDALAAPAVEGYADLSDEEAERRARLRLQALYQRVIRDSYTVAELGRRPGISRQRLKQLRDKDRLFAIEVPFQRGLLYPRWQFGLGDGRPRPQMPRLIGAAREAGLDAISFHMTMNNAAAGGGLSPLDLLEDGEESQVVAILRGADQ